MKVEIRCKTYDSRQNLGFSDSVTDGRFYQYIVKCTKAGEIFCVSTVGVIFVLPYLRSKHTLNLHSIDFKQQANTFELHFNDFEKCACFRPNSYSLLLSWGGNPVGYPHCNHWHTADSQYGLKVGLPAHSRRPAVCSAGSSATPVTSTQANQTDTQERRDSQYFASTSGASLPAQAVTHARPSSMDLRTADSNSSAAADESGNESAGSSAEYWQVKYLCNPDSPNRSVSFSCDIMLCDNTCVGYTGFLIQSSCQ